METNELTELITKLKRYSFESKMEKCQKYSEEHLDFFVINISDDMDKIPLPWELETFTVLSIQAKEWRNNELDEVVFRKAINTIRDFVPEKLKKSEEKFRDIFLTTAGNQFRVQRAFSRELYRYNYYFNFSNEEIDVKKSFENKFNCSYKDFCVFVSSLWSFLVLKRKKKNDSLYVNKCVKFIEYIKNKYKKVLENLSCSRDEYIKLLDLGPDDLTNGTKPSYAYPFIKCNNKVYLPLTHLLFIAITEFLMFRFTEGDHELRGVLGKEVLENYLFHIIDKGKFFDEVKQEYEYNKGKKKFRTIDIMAKKGNDIVFFDSKSTVPNSKITVIDEEAIEKNCKIMAKACVQMYKHLRQKFQLEYDPFSLEVETSSSNLWGIVVVSVDSYLKRDDIYQKAAIDLGIAVDSLDYEWLCLHVVVVELSVIEGCFLGDNNKFLDNIKERATQKKLYSFVTNNDTLSGKKVIVNEEFQLFQNGLMDPVLEEFVNNFHEVIIK